METKRLCPSCQKPLPPEVPLGLCPACLVKAGFPSGAASATGSAAPAAFVPPAAGELAELFPQLEILELIGQGGMGAVYRARQKNLNRLVALKILPPGIGGEPAFAQRFTREAQALARLNHPGIVTLYEFGETRGQYYFLMEYVDGVTLRQLLRGGRVSAREALAIVPQICDALQFAHDQGIVHRDIKPENILLDRRGRVKVADFGLAKIVAGERPENPAGGAATAGSASLTEAGKILGTPQYMSPEQIQAPDGVDHRADIYALGVVFYQMLTGELPGKTIEPPSRKVHIDVRLDEVVLRALAQKPELRYQQANVLKTQIETIASTPAEARTSASRPAPPPAAVPSAPAAAPSPSRPAKANIIGWAKVVLVLAGAIMLIVMIKRQSHPAAAVTTEFDGQMFVVDAAAARQFAPILPVSNTIVHVDLSREAFLRLRELAKTQGSPVSRLASDVNGWPRVADSRSLGDCRVSATGGGFLGIRQHDGYLEARLEYHMLSGFTFSADKTFASLIYECPAPLTNVLVFLQPMSSAISNASFLVLGWQVTRGETMPVPAYELDTTNNDTGNRAVAFAHDGTNVNFVIFTSADIGAPMMGVRGKDPSQTWEVFGEFSFPSGRTVPYRQNSARASHLDIGAQSYNLHDGSLVVLAENGTVIQLPVFPDLATARNLDKITRWADLNNLTASSNYPWSSGSTLKTVPASLLTQPPRLRFLAWQDEWRTNAPGAARHPDGSPITDASELQWLKAVHHENMVMNPGQLPRKPRFFMLWFSHPAFDADSSSDLTLLDEHGHPLALGANGSMFGSHEDASERNGQLGWEVKTLSLAPGKNQPAHLTLRLAYTLGPLERTQTMTVIPKQSQGMTLEGGGGLNGVGQNIDGRAFVSLASDAAKLGARRFGVMAVAKDGSRLLPSRKGHSGYADGSGVVVDEFDYDLPLAAVDKFIIGTRPIRTNEWKNVVLP